MAEHHLREQIELLKAENRMLKAANDYAAREIARLTTKPKRSAPQETPQGDKEVVPSVELRALLQPLIELNSINWVATRARTSSALLKENLYEKKYCNLSTVDRWLTNIGLDGALSDGTLNIVANPNYVAPDSTPD